jgi:predicted  nucleic acid-binding Zn-ribbon protein
MIAVPADAAVKISNGVACKKSGQTTKTSGGTYRCAKNPLVSSTKLTWLSLDCLTAANDAVKSQKAAVTTAANFKAQLPVIDLGITTETANKAEIQVKLDEANKRLIAAQAKLAAATTEADKKILTTAVGSWTSATRAYGSKIRNIDITIKKLEAAKLAATNKPAELARNIADARESAKLICTKGF